MTLNLIVSKVNLQLIISSAFPTLPSKQFKLERPSMENIKFEHLTGVFGML